MPKPSTIDVSAGDLAYHLRRHPPPDELALARPSAVARHPTIDEARLATVTSQHASRVLALRGWQNAGVTDVVEDAAGVIEPQDKSRGEPGCVLHVTSHDAIDGSQASHLDPEALAGAIWKAAPLGDDALDATNAE